MIKELTREHIEEKLDSLRDYVTLEVHTRCDYDIYSHLIDSIDELSYMNEEVSHKDNHND